MRGDLRALTAAAVLGRPGEVEPWAAALALALLRRMTERAGAVVVIGAESGEPVTGGTPAAGRLAARLRAHGLPAAERGRLAWVPLGADDVPAAHRATIVAAPAVLAVTTPLTGALERVLADLDLIVLVTSRPDGPLAELATATLGTLGVPLLTGPPLPRGPARALARAGIATARSVRALLAALDGAR
jgi:hypothetical protein